MRGTKKEQFDYNVEVTRAKEIKDGVVIFDMKVNGVTIYGCVYREYTNKEGKEGVLISFPSRKADNGEYYSHAWFPISRELREEICSQVEKVVSEVK